MAVTGVEVLDPNVDQPGYDRVPIAVQAKAGGVSVQLAQIDVGDAATATPLTAGQKTMAGSVPVVMASDQSAMPVSLASSNLTPARSIVSALSTVAAGAQVVGFKNIGTVNVTVLGVALVPNDSRVFAVPFPYKLAAIAYDATGGSLEIAEVR